MSELLRTIEQLPDLEGQLCRLVRQIPPGGIATYGDLARALGDVAASRWIGSYLRSHDSVSNCDCHRVVRSNGEIGLYAHGDTTQKAKRLAEEGVGVDWRSDGNPRIVINGGPRFCEFDSDRPLERLRKVQNATRNLRNDNPLQATVKTVAGVDLSYSDKTAVAAYAVFDLETRSTIETITVSHAVTFPYITSYLAYRELPPLMQVTQRAAELGIAADVIMVDGSGLLHPRQAGVATLLGMLLDRPTIGVTKKLLCGVFDHEALRYRQAVEINHADTGERGAAILSTERTSNPIFVSVGHKISLEQATNIVVHCLAGHRSPEPIYLADRESRLVAKSI